jgi:hypothetical protein
MISSMICLLSAFRRGLYACIAWTITPLVRAWAISAALPRF